MSVRFTLLAAVAFSLACATPQLEFKRAPLRRPIVERLRDGSLRIQWPASFSPESVAVYAGLSPDAIDHGTPVAVVSGRSVRLPSDHPQIDPDRRLYYELVPTSGDSSFVAAERRLPLDCCDNFRDLGGYATADGRRVRWNRLYRANELSGLSGDDLEYLSQLGINLVCDFRGDRERDASPDRVIEPRPAEQLNLPVAAEGVDPAVMKRKIRTGGMAALAVEKTMRDAYRSFVTDYSDEWAKMFRRLAQPESLPGVVHCTAGKDRTGFASALVLLALGVPEDVVFEDYLLTNYYQQNFFRSVLRWVPLYSFFRTDPADLLPLLEARRSYLQTSLDAIIEHHGSVDAYLENALGVDAELRAQLQEQLLTVQTPAADYSR